MSDAPTDPTATFRLDEKVVLITGASSGLGARFARVAAAAGATVIGAARRADRLAALVTEIEAAHGVGRAHAVEVDLTALGPGRPSLDVLAVGSRGQRHGGEGDDEKSCTDEEVRPASHGSFSPKRRSAGSRPSPGHVRGRSPTPRTPRRAHAAG